MSYNYKYYEQSPIQGTIIINGDTVTITNVGGTNTQVQLTNANFNEIRLIPKSSSSGAEGTVFYCSDDNGIYVGVE